MKKPFREYHLLNLLAEYDQRQLPLDASIADYFKAHSALGSKDRAFIAEQAYSLMRWQGLLDHLINGTVNWEKRLECYLQGDFKKAIRDQSIPHHIRCSFPKELFDLLTKSYGLEKAFELSLISNEMAPTTIRVNTLKTDRDTLLKRWQSLYDVVPCQFSETGIIFRKKIHFYSLPEFKEGLFEIQDEGSQLLSYLVKATPGQEVLDFCAGSGGKTLAFAPGMKGKGQIFLHDIRPHALLEAKRRLRRAGIQNAQVVMPDENKLSLLKGRMDWVLVDAPCSGTGTLRRNPDMKWRFSEEMLTRLVGQQREIFGQALEYLKPNGRIVYGTCSLLKEENQNQLSYCLEKYSLKQVGETFVSLPTSGGMDGFYGVTLKFQQ